MAGNAMNRLEASWEIFVGLLAGFLLGGLFTYWAVATHRKAVALAARGVETEGTVGETLTVRYRSRHRRYGSSYDIGKVPAVMFKDGAGKAHEITRSKSFPFEAGAKVTVRYDAENPRVADVLEAPKYTRSGVWGLGAAAALGWAVMAGCLYLFHRDSAPRTENPNARQLRKRAARRRP